MGLIFKILLITIALVWLFKQLFRFFIRSFINNLTDNQQNKTKKTKTRKQGDVHIDKQPARDKKIKDDVGEYVDYEEIK